MNHGYNKNQVFMNKSLLAFITATLIPFSAYTKEPEKVFDLHYYCEANGCEIACKEGNKKEFLVIAHGAKKIVSFNYPNGNMEFFVDKGINGKEKLIVGKHNLQCKITGIK